MRSEVVIGNALSVCATLPDQSLHLTLTSPPYYRARMYEGGGVAESYVQYMDDLSRVFGHILRATLPGRYCVINSSPVLEPRPSRTGQSLRHPIPFDLHARMMAMGWEFVEDIVWRKPDPSVAMRVGGFERHPNPLTYKPNLVTEYVMCYRRPSGRLPEQIADDYPEEVRVASRVSDAMPRTNVWEVSPARHPLHPAVMPAMLAERIVRLYSFEGDMVFDPYAGTGTTARAAHRWRRRWMMVERNPQYMRGWVAETGCAVRWADTPLDTDDGAEDYEENSTL